MVVTADNNRELTFNAEPNSTNDSQLLHNEVAVSKIKTLCERQHVEPEVKKCTVLICAVFFKNPWLSTSQSEGYLSFVVVLFLCAAAAS